MSTLSEDYSSNFHTTHHFRVTCGRSPKARIFADSHSALLAAVHDSKRWASCPAQAVCTCTSSCEEAKDGDQIVDGIRRLNATLFESILLSVAITRSLKRLSRSQHTAAQAHGHAALKKQVLR